MALINWVLPFIKMFDLLNSPFTRCPCSNFEMSKVSIRNHSMLFVLLCVKKNSNNNHFHYFYFWRDVIDTSCNQQQKSNFWIHWRFSVRMDEIFRDFFQIYFFVWTFLPDWINFIHSLLHSFGKSRNFSVFLYFFVCRLGSNDRLFLHLLVLIQWNY